MEKLPDVPGPCPLWPHVSPKKINGHLKKSGQQKTDEYIFLYCCEAQCVPCAVHCIAECGINNPASCMSCQTDGLGWAKHGGRDVSPQFLSFWDSFSSTWPAWLQFFLWTFVFARPNAVDEGVQGVSAGWQTYDFWIERHRWARTLASCSKVLRFAAMFVWFFSLELREFHHLKTLICQDFSRKNFLCKFLGLVFLDLKTHAYTNLV